MLKSHYSFAIYVEFLGDRTVFMICFMIFFFWNKSLKLQYNFSLFSRIGLKYIKDHIQDSGDGFNTGIFFYGLITTMLLIIMRKINSRKIRPWQFPFIANSSIAMAHCSHNIKSDWLVRG